MKKLLLISASAAVAMGTMAAAPDKPTVEPGLTIQYVSNNGKYVGASYNGAVWVKNLETGVERTFGGDETGEMYSLGFQFNSVSDNGIFAGSTNSNDAAVYDFEKNQWTQLFTPTDGIYGAYSITTDGNMVCGYISNPDINPALPDNTMTVPALWVRGDDGKFGRPQLIDYPKTDITGRPPMYIMPLAPAPDGKSIAGLAQQCTGMQNEPVMWTLQDDGTWKWALIQPELLNPNKVTFPEWVEYPEQPDPKTYLSATELSSYEAAYAKYEEDFTKWQNDCFESGNWDTPAPEMPDVTTYMSAQKKAEYEKAQTDYQAAAEVAQQKQQAWFDAFNSTGAPEIAMGQMFYNGKECVINLTIPDPNSDPMAWFPETLSATMRLNPASQTERSTISDIQATVLGGDGTILGSYYDDNNIETAAVVLPGAGEASSYVDWLGKVNPDYVKWVNENMTHDYTTWVEDPETFEYVEKVLPDYLFTGTPFSSTSLNLVSNMVSNQWATWDDETGTSSDPNAYYSYLFPTNLQASIEGVAATDAAALTLTALRGGVIRVQGNARSMQVVDLQGREVFATDAPAAEVSTGLNGGIYLVKAVDADGRETVVKAAF